MLGTAKEEETSEVEDEVMTIIGAEEEILVIEEIHRVTLVWKTPPAIIAVAEVISPKIVHQHLNETRQIKPKMQKRKRNLSRNPLMEIGELGRRKTK